MGASGIGALAMTILLAGCASAPTAPWTPSEYHVSEEDFDKAWDASVVTISIWFEQLAHVNKAERRIESDYYYPPPGTRRQKAFVRIDPDPPGYVVRVRTAIEELTSDFPPRWVFRATDLKANGLLLEEIRRRTYGLALDRPQTPPD